MLRKKDLTIETEFFEDSIQGIPNAIMISPIYQHQQNFIKSGLNEDDDCLRSAAQIIERLLTTKLIDNFIHCWHTLKNNTILQTAPIIHRALSSVQRISSHQSYIQAEDNTKKTYDRMSSQDAEVHSSKIEWLQQRQQVSYNRKLVGDYQERTIIIKQIVDKLRRGREEVYQLSYSLDRVGHNYYVQEQISRLQKVAQQLQIQRMYMHNQNTSLQQNNLNYGNNEFEVQQVEEQEQQNELQVKLWNEIIELRNELKELKLESQEIQEIQQRKIQQPTANNSQQQREEQVKLEQLNTSIKLIQANLQTRQAEDTQSRLLAQKEQIKRQYQLRSQMQHHQLAREIELLKQAQQMQHQYLQQTIHNNNKPVQKEILHVGHLPAKLLYSVDIQTDPMKSSKRQLQGRVSQEMQTSPRRDSNAAERDTGREMYQQQTSPYKVNSSQHIRNQHRNTLLQQETTIDQHRNNSNIISSQVSLPAILKLSNLQSLQAKANNRHFAGHIDRESTGRSETKTNQHSEMSRYKNTLSKNAVNDSTQPREYESDKPKNIIQKQSSPPKDVVEIQSSTSQISNIVSNELAKILAVHKELRLALQATTRDSEAHLSQLSSLQRREDQQFKITYEQNMREIHQKIGALQLQKQQSLMYQNLTQAQQQLEQQQQQQKQEQQQYRQHYLLVQQQQNALQTQLHYETQLRESLSRQLELKQRLLREQAEKESIWKAQMAQQQQLRLQAQRQHNFTQQSQRQQKIKVLKEEQQVLRRATDYQLQIKDRLIEQQQAELKRLQQQLMHTQYYLRQQQNQQRVESQEVNIHSRQEGRPAVGFRNSSGNNQQLKHLNPKTDLGQTMQYSVGQYQTNVQQPARHIQPNNTRLHINNLYPPATNLQQQSIQYNQQPTIQHSNLQQTATLLHATPHKVNSYQSNTQIDRNQTIRLQQSKVYPVNIEHTTPATLKAAFTTQRSTYATAPLAFTSYKQQTSAYGLATKAQHSLYSKECNQTKSKIIYWPKQERNSQNCACCF